MKDAILKLITDVYGSFNNLGQSSNLIVSLEQFNPALYGYIVAINKNVVLPVAYVVLSLFFMLELYNISTRAQGGGSQLGAELVFKAMLKMVLCKMAVDYAMDIINALYNAGLELLNGISGVVSSSGLNISQADLEIPEDFWQQIGMLLQLLITNWVVGGLALVVSAIVLARFLELYVFAAVSPIPLATLPSDEMSSIGKNFLKRFAAVSLQGAILFIVLSFFPIIVGAGGSMGAGVFSLIGYAIVLILAVVRSGSWAKSICGAM